MSTGPNAGPRYAVSVETEIAAVEERLRLAQLHSDAKSVEDLLDDHLLLLSDGSPFFAKARMLEVYKPGRGRLVSVEWKNVQIIEFGKAAVVICRGVYQAAQMQLTLQLM